MLREPFVELVIYKRNPNTLLLNVRIVLIFGDGGSEMGISDLFLDSGIASLGVQSLGL